jgi:hypothetical protein
MSNPYKPKRVWAHRATANLAGDAPMPYQTASGKLQYGGKMAGANGEFNANSKKDLVNIFQALAAACQAGDFVETAAHDTQAEARKKELVTAAISDKDGPAWKALGEVIGDEVAETMGRQAFASKTLIHRPLEKGEVGRIRIRKKDVLCFFATRNPEVVASQIRQMYAYPPEYYLVGRVLAEDAEIEQSSGDLLDDKYQDLLEAMLRQQDLVWKKLIDTSATAYNDSFLFNTFTPTVFSNMQNQVIRWGIPVHMCVLSYDLWPDITADTEFSTWFDPVSKHELVMNGYIGNIMGTQIHTDGFRYETLKVLEPGEVYFLGQPSNLGAITRRKDLATAPINLHLLGRPERGWFAEQIEGMVIPNPRAAVKGRKI